MVSLGEVDQNLAQAKKVKTDFDEVSLGMVFKQFLGSAEVAIYATPPGAISIMSWNCRGLENPWAVQALKGVIRREDSSLVFLMETKLNVEEMRKVKRDIGML